MSSTKNPTIPTRKSALIFRGKASILQGKRYFTDFLDSSVTRHARGTELESAPVLAVSRGGLWTEDDPKEKFLVAGKIQNLRVAVQQLNGIEVPAEKVFSFWKQIGRASRFRGFVAGREIREGCIIPNVGGGLCQLSNALYDAALHAGFEIVERHAHTQVVAGSLAEVGRDATVFWNYVDLRFRSTSPFRIEARMEADELIVALRGDRTNEKFVHLTSKNSPDTTLNSCATCGVSECHRVVRHPREKSFGRTAFLVDEYIPEFQKYIDNATRSGDRLLVPIDGVRFRKANYAWRANGFDDVDQSVVTTLHRSFHSRRLSQQGATRQRNLLEFSERLARSYARKLRFDDLHLVVHQDLVKFLWRDGVLGGRTFDVLMTALPIEELQTRLDHARDFHPESSTLGDFRADEHLLVAESEALKRARRIFTPHSEIASLFPEKSELLGWEIPEIVRRESAKKSKPRVIFPASTVGRKGCYELREALRGIDATLVLLGPVIESTDFWGGFETIKGGSDWIHGATTVVLPAFVEHRPRRLLAAAANGVPVIATPACGVTHVDGVRTVPAGDPDGLRTALLDTLAVVE